MSAFEITVQAALGFVSQSANDFIIYAASKKISLSADSDQMAPPSGLLPPLKSWTKLFTFVFICAGSLVCHSVKKYPAQSVQGAFVCIYADITSRNLSSFTGFEK
ncbi:MAG: hypothetical protein ACLSHR_06470 [Oscillospiraceae bacterium]